MCDFSCKAIYDEEYVKNSKIAIFAYSQSPEKLY